MSLELITGTFVHLPVCLAHAGSAIDGPRGWSELWGAWEWDPFVVLALLATAWIYARGSRRLRAEVSRGRGLRGWEIACFWTGWLTLVIALVSPLHPWGQVLFSAHMTQHELLMVAAAPLLVLGRPVVAMLFALPRGDARELSRLARGPRIRAIWSAATNPLVAWAVHALALWFWHVPPLFQATLRSEPLHHLQHVSFFGSALLFWWALIHGRAGIRGFGVAILYVFTTMLHTGLLGALLTFAGTLIYPAYQQTAPDWSLTPLEDQQLGGVIMWVPAGLVYVCAALALLAGWLRHADRQAALRWPARLARTVPMLLILLTVGCSRPEVAGAIQLTRGGPEAGRQAIARAGCGSCHTIPGIAGARAIVGPPLTGIANRNYIAGVLPNEPEAMIRWLLDPGSHSPKTVMPDTGLSEQEARDIAAYLYTLREN